MTRTQALQPEFTTRQIRVGVDKQTLRIQFSRKLSQELFRQKQKYLYLGLSNTPENLIEAEKIALQIENDIRAKKLEKDLNLYLPANQLKQSIGIFYDPNHIDIKLNDLFNQFCEFIKPQLQESTYLATYQRRYKVILEKAPQDLNSPTQLIDYFFKFHTIYFTELAALVSRIFNWGQKRKLITEKVPNNFLSISKDYKVFSNNYIPGSLVTESVKNYNHDQDYRAFTREEAKLIIQRFEERANERIVYRRSTGPYHLSEKKIQSRCTMRDYIKLKFWTGCRSGEASALRWLDIGDNFEYILFRNNYTRITRGLKPLKTEHIGEEGKHTRKFICGKKLQLLLEDMYRRNYRENLEDFLFLNMAGNPINDVTICHQWYGFYGRRFLENITLEKYAKLGVVTQLVIEKKINQYLTPYATRHTWITLQLLDGVHINNVAKLAGNSPQTILAHYSSFVPNLPLAGEI